MLLKPDIDTTDSKKEVSCLNWSINNGKRNICVHFKPASDKLTTFVNNTATV